MGREGLMTPEEAERKIWEYYWQLDQSVDRRTAPIRFSEPPDTLDQDEAAVRQEGLWATAQAYVDDKLRGVKERAGKLFGGLRRQRYEKEVAGEALRDIGTDKTFQDMVDVARAEKDLKGRVDPKTGLPLSASDLAVGRGVVTGIDLCLDTILPPGDLAAACTAWLEPCPEGENPETWGNETEHWQVMAHKDRDTPCEECDGTGRKIVEVTSRSSGGLILIRRESTKKEEIPCDACGGRGSINNWTTEELDTVRQNTHQIKRAAHRLAGEGFFDLRPIDPHDTEMHDLNWTDQAGHTIGFRLTYEGYEHLHKMCEEDEELRNTVRQHVLALAGREVRESAPEWAKKQYEQQS